MGVLRWRAYLDSWFIAQASPALHANLLFPPPPHVEPVTAVFLPPLDSSTHEEFTPHPAPPHTPPQLPYHSISFLSLISVHYIFVHVQLITFVFL